MVMVKPQSSPLMETVKLDETDAAKTAYQPNSEVLPLIETARAGNQQLHIELGCRRLRRSSAINQIRLGRYGGGQE